jgi:ECF transporter S component (folate family)
MGTRDNTQYTKRIVQTGLFIALALIIRSFSYMVYIGGAPGMRISFSGIFTSLPAILFGPIYGGCASGILDILGFVMKPEGGYIPWLTLTAILGGVITGLLWKAIKNVDVHKFQKGLLILFIIIGVIGGINHLNVLLLPNNPWAQVINSIGKNKDFVTIGLEVASLIGIGLLVIDLLIQRRYKNAAIHHNYLKLLIVIGISGICVTTLNTYILQVFIPALGKKGFMIFWIPRVVQEILMTVIQTYVISILLSIYQRLLNKIQS